MYGCWRSGLGGVALLILQGHPGCHPGCHPDCHLVTCSSSPPPLQIPGINSNLVFVGWYKETSNQLTHLSMPHNSTSRALRGLYSHRHSNINSYLHVNMKHKTIWTHKVRMMNHITRALTRRSSHWRLSEDDGSCIRWPSRGLIQAIDYVLCVLRCPAPRSMWHGSLHVLLYSYFVL